MKKIFKYFFFIILILYSLFFVVGSILSPILAHFKLYELSTTLTGTFMYSCHQQPDRSFWILGYPIALCARCLGVYVGTIISSFLILMNKIKINKKNVIILLSIISIDIFINYGLGIRTHNTGNITRFTIGLIMGILIAYGINKIIEFKRREKDET